MRKFRMTPRVALKTVKEIGLPSPSSRTRVAKKDHHACQLLNE